MSSSTGRTPSAGGSRTIEPELSADDRTALLRLARATLEALVDDRELPSPPRDAVPGAKRGAFVTLEAGGVLRGCIGHVDPDRALTHVVRDMTVAAARDDRRFPPVAAEEVPTIRIEISVLTDPTPLDPVEPARIALGRDGLLVRRGRAMGLLLPRVATEHRFGPEAFLAAACRKAGLPPGAWRERGTRVFTFRADVFGE